MSHAPNRSLTEIAMECGFSSSSDFSRCFKAHFGTAPSSFDLAAFRNSGRQKFVETLSSQENGPHLPRLKPGENPDQFTAKILKLAPRTVAYIRVLDPYQSDAVVGACNRLLEWADCHGYGNGQWLGYMWEDPEIVDLKDCRYDVAVVIEEDGNSDFRPQGEIGRYEFPAMQVAEVVVKGDINLEQRAIDWLFGTWLPQSGYEPDNQPAFEAWHGRPFAHGYEHFELSCHLPIKKA